ncbi:FliI/YscN family ATPase [Terriglobus saanensis]|uniref:ATPase, FliI/YscN family n=1 Tax=Terriglobus saanensis (strain ATCC BAA-1853 / DSM 23119 / SP1PR4) TaxID=401053 RepID=E8V4Z3_TERSS|nr:FliI/YscN family ATPase [Terriglobus saanensis]ADV82621.1 ATPase, FliI/YscN family [Terriglobus saanensis SP1PR4]
MPLASYFNRLQQLPSARWYGRVVEATAQTISSDGPSCSVGEACEIVDSKGGYHAAEVIGFRGSHLISMPLSSSRGIRFGDRVMTTGEVPSLGVGEDCLGRVLDARGRPIDERQAPRVETFRPLDGDLPMAMHRVPIQTPLATGVRVLDAMMTVGRGQRVGIFGGSGVGKSTLIGMMTRNTSADLTIVGLVGERGREVREFLEDSLGEKGRRRSVTVVSTSDESPLMRMRAALAATTLAESYAAKGKHVLLVLDSLTRYAMAAREVGLAAGEPAATKGYTPSVFAKMARLVERAGNFGTGSMTAFYTVLMEGDDQQDPLVDAARSLLDGHIVLSREMASAGIYPPVHVLDSLSRLMPAVISAEHRQDAAKIRRTMATYARSEDMVRLGMYKSGMDAELDHAIRMHPRIQTFFQQTSEERADYASTLAALHGLEMA